MAKDRILPTISLTSSSETLSVNEKLLIDHLDEEAEQLETTELMAGSLLGSFLLNKMFTGTSLIFIQGLVCGG